MKMNSREEDHYRGEVDTAATVRFCYEMRCLGDKLTPEKVYALCRLTWCNDGKASWRNIILPAVWILWNKRGEVPHVEDLAELRNFGFSPRLIELVHQRNGGFVNFYKAYRNSSKKWIEQYFDEIAPLIHKAARLSSDNDARIIMQAIEKLPGIPKANKQLGKISADSLLTPLIACLDPRAKFPIINKADHVVRLHQRLGLTDNSLTEKYNTLIRLIGQRGIKDAFILDVCSDHIDKIATTRAKQKHIRENRNRPLSEKDDSDVNVISKTRSRKAKRLHNSMTNTLVKMCHKVNYEVIEGTSGDAEYDALIKNYDDKGKDLLIEVKSSQERGNLRLAVGQLLDYRRHLPRRAATDLAILLPEKPNKNNQEFLDDVGVQFLWFDDEYLKTIRGSVRLKFSIEK
ncbi:MAG: hypothetical protein WC974_00150 [Thermoplasmata archaeon]